MGRTVEPTSAASSLSARAAIPVVTPLMELAIISETMPRICDQSSGRGIMASVPASPASRIVGPVTMPPFAICGISRVFSLAIFTPGMALITSIAKLIALIKPLMILTAPPITALIAPFTAPLMASPTAVPMEVKSETMVFQTPWKNAPTCENTDLMPSQAAEKMPVNQLTTEPKTALMPSQTVWKKAPHVFTIPLMASHAPAKSPERTA